MPRYRVTLEYDGGPFSGWQRQDNGPSVQGALEEAIFKLSGERVTATGAGRTDAGVHARGQIAHFDLVKEFPPDTVRDALNAHLRPNPVAVLEAAVAAEDFHARFSAVARHYEYRILCRRARRPSNEAMSGMSRASLIFLRCRQQREPLSASMISRRFAPPNARRNHP